MNKTALFLLLFTLTVSLWHCRLELEELDFIVVRTEAPTPLNAITLTVRGEVEGLVNGRLRDHGHVWSSSVEQLTLQAGDTTALGPRSGNGEFLSTIDVDRLASNTEYFFRAYAWPEEGAPVYSDEITSIRTGSVMAATGEEVPVNIVTFILPGEINDLILGQVREHGHLWWTASLSNPAPTLADSAGLAGYTLLGQRISNGSFFSIADSLTPRTTYFFRAYALIDTLFYGGAVDTFQSGTIQVTTDRLLINDAREAEAIGTISNLSLLHTLGYTVSEYGHVWTTDGSEPSFENNNFLDRTTFFNLDEDILFSSNLGPVLNAVPYRVRSYAVLDGQVVESGDVIGNTFDTGFWTEVTALPGARRKGAVAFVMNDRAYLCAGESELGLLNDLYRYHPGNDQWSSRADYDSLRTQAVAFVINDESAYVGTGWDGTAFRNDFRRYDPDDDQWNDDVDPIPGARSQAVAFTLGDKGYVGLGVNDNGLLGDFYVYDSEAPTGEEWDPLAFAFPGPPRAGAVAFTIGGKAYVGLGWDGSNSYYNDFFEFDPNNGWSFQGEIADLPATSGIRNAVAFSLDNGKGYVAWGTGPNGQRNELWEYNPGSNTWTPVIVFPPGGRTGAVGFGIGNEGFIGTGNAETGATRDFWRFIRN